MRFVENRAPGQEKTVEFEPRKAALINEVCKLENAPQDSLVSGFFFKKFRDESIKRGSWWSHRCLRGVVVRGGKKQLWCSGCPDVIFSRNNFDSFLEEQEIIFGLLALQVRNFVEVNTALQKVNRELVTVMDRTEVMEPAEVLAIKEKVLGLEKEVQLDGVLCIRPFPWASCETVGHEK